MHANKTMLQKKRSAAEEFCGNPDLLCFKRTENTKLLRKRARLRTRKIQIISVRRRRVAGNQAAKKPLGQRVYNKIVCAKMCCATHILVRVHCETRNTHNIHRNRN